MDMDRLKEDFGHTWKWLAEGWRNISSGAANALTYFSPTKSDDEPSSMRWGLMAVDVQEKDDHVLIELEAPGLEKDEIDVTVDGRRLIITGTKRYESKRQEGSLRISERAFGSFQRVIPLTEEAAPLPIEADDPDLNRALELLGVRLVGR